MTTLFDLSGKTALITGSTRGLGFAYASGLAEAGANVILNGTSQHHMDTALSTLQAKGYNASGFIFNVPMKRRLSGYSVSSIKPIFTSISSSTMPAFSSVSRCWNWH